MKLIYIAGPYRHREGGPTVEQNILSARRRALGVVKQGLKMFPVAPHMATANLELDLPDVSDEYFLAGTMAMMQRCDAVLLTYQNAPLDSEGTRKEMYNAHYFGIPVFSNLRDLVNWYYMQETGDEHDEKPTPPAAPV